ncbi:MAG: hypothetical protein D8M59_08255 [Planctomycetes bacterium]|nr:hypothetical protein [Planctomycetota bacterium]NOG54014.1 hypothetical protein [Planctomycetota bacterium]
MKKSGTLLVATAAMASMATYAAAQPIVDGVVTEGDYGAPLWVNDTNPTGFGNNLDPSVGCADGSEIDALYAVIADNGLGDMWLYIGITGNLESNFNKLELFIDTTEGVGQNILPAINPDVDFGALQRMGDDGSGNGLAFDALFTANAYFTMTNGNCDGEFTEVYANFADLDNQLGYYLGMTSNGIGFLEGGDNPFGIEATIDNSNIDGIDDLVADYSAALAVTTGIEIAIPMAALGDPTDDLLLCAFINGGGHDWISSQVVGGGLWGADNLAEPRTTNFAALYGNQYVTVANGTPRTGAFIIHVGPLYAGQNGQFGVEGAAANEMVYWAYSLRGLGSQFVPPLNVILDLHKPAEVGHTRADANGHANLELKIPGPAAGRTIWFQGCHFEAKTNAVAVSVQ